MVAVVNPVPRNVECGDPESTFGAVPENQSMVYGLCVYYHRNREGREFNTDNYSNNVIISLLFLVIHFSTYYNDTPQNADHQDHGR
jgi:hypothetical protein